MRRLSPLIAWSALAICFLSSSAVASFSTIVSSTGVVIVVVFVLLVRVVVKSPPLSGCGKIGKALLFCRDVIYCIMEWQSHIPQGFLGHRSVFLLWDLSTLPRTKPGAHALASLSPAPQTPL